MLYDLLRTLERRGVLFTPTASGFTAGPVAALKGKVTQMRQHRDALTHLLGRVGEGTSAGALLDVYLCGYTVVRSADDLRAVVARLRWAPAVALNLETTGRDPLSDRIRLVSLAGDLHTYVVDTVDVPIAAVRDILTPLMQGEALLVLHNASGALEFLAAAGIAAGPVRLYDTGVAEQLIRHTAVMPSLRELAEVYVGLALEQSPPHTDWRGELTEWQRRYAASNARVTYLVYMKQHGALRRYGLERAAQIDFGAIPAVAWMHRAGVPFNLDRWYGVVQEEERQAAEALARLAPGVNWNSPAQVLAALRNAGVPLNDTRFETLVLHRDYPVVAALLRYREHQKRVSTYGANWAHYLHPQTGRIHPSWAVIGAETGRMSCTAPNLMQVPRSAAFRRCVCAPEGSVLVTADYSQIELRLAALIAGDSTMLEALRNGVDLHTITAMAITGKPASAITREERRLAKALNFGLLYGMGAETLRVYAQTGYGVHLTTEEAVRLKEVFFATYPGLRRWHMTQARGTTPVRTLSGRRRVVERFTERLNTPIQGTGADIMKRALALLYERRRELPDAVPILTVHDEIVLEAPAHLGEQARQHLERAMLDAADEITAGGVPIVVEAGVYQDWGVTAV